MPKKPDAIIVIEDDGSIWYDITDYQDDNSQWVHLGIAPKPKNKLDVFIYHMCNGILMHYPIIDVILFSIKNIDSFSGKEIDSV